MFTVPIKHFTGGKFLSPPPFLRLLACGAALVWLSGCDRLEPLLLPLAVGNVQQVRYGVEGTIYAVPVSHLWQRDFAEVGEVRRSIRPVGDLRFRISFPNFSGMSRQEADLLRAGRGHYPDRATEERHLRDVIFVSFMPALSVMGGGVVPTYPTSSSLARWEARFLETVEGWGQDAILTQHGTARCVSSRANLVAAYCLGDTSSGEHIWIDCNVGMVNMRYTSWCNVERASPAGGYAAAYSFPHHLLAHWLEIDSAVLSKLRTWQVKGPAV